MTLADIKAEPLAVWDVRDEGSLFWQHWGETHAWARDHYRDRGMRTYRTEFYLLDAPFAVMYRYAADESGQGRRVRYNTETGGPDLEEPVVEMLDELPPAHLLGR